MVLSTQRVEADSPLRIAYVVARFPKTTETFVVRELNRVAASPGIDARLLALYAPQVMSNIVHPGAEAWVESVSRPTSWAGMRALARWLMRRPIATVSTCLLLLWGFKRRPTLALKALATMVIACAHAEDLLADEVEHVHAHFLGNTATAAWVIQRLAQIPYSATAHAYDLFIDQDFLVRRVRDAQFVVAISEFNVEFISKLCRGLTPPVRVIHAGIDLPAFPFVSRRLPATGRVRALAVGSLLAHKAHLLLLEALVGDDPLLERIDLTIVGEGEQRPALEGFIRRHSLEKRVELLGAQPEDQVASLLKEADIFILPSKISSTGRMEGIPVVLMEALASGVPTVATRLSGIPELIEDGVTGALAEPGDIASLRQAILRTLADPDRAADLALVGRRRVESDFDVETSAAALVHLFRAARAGELPPWSTTA